MSKRIQGQGSTKPTLNSPNNNTNINQQNEQNDDDYALIPVDLYYNLCIKYFQLKDSFKKSQEN